MVRIAINGYGRIGRNILRAYYERSDLRSQLQIVAINDLGDVNINAHLTQFDTVHGRFYLPVTSDENHIIIDGDSIRVLSERDPSKLPWKELNVDLVFECTGLFKSRDKAAAHLEAGAKRVLISAPGKGADATIVHGINDHLLTQEHIIVSSASCTTNCLAPLLKPISDSLGIESGFMTTIHSYTNDQNLSDTYHADIYRSRSATQSMIPTKTGATRAIGLVMPELKGKLDGLAIRVPTINVSLVDLTIVTSKATSVEEVTEIMEQAASSPLGKVLSISTRPLVSIDFNHNPYSCNFDKNHTKVNGNLVKVLAWYDNEWGFSNRMLDNALVMVGVSSGTNGQKPDAA